jgi:hypothetical protein
MGIRIIKSKKAGEVKFVHFVIWAIFLVYVLMVIVIFTSAFVRNNMDIRDAEARIIANRLLYAPEGISYTDTDLGRNYPGTVDLARANSSDVLDSAAWMPDNQMMAGSVTVYDMKGRQMTKPGIYNTKWYFRWLPLVEQEGSGAVTEIVETRYALVYDNGNYKGKGKVEIQVLVPNS